MSKRVLFVDDEEDWRLVVGTHLKDAGHMVWTAADASEALQQTDGVRLDLVILDVNLAGESGLEFMKFIQVNHRDVPVILFTGLEHDHNTIRDLLKQGVRSYVRKGSISDLLGAVQKALA